MPSIRCLSLKTGKDAPIPPETVLCLGNFDGVHLGHQALFRRAISLRDRDFPNAAVGVLCFRIPSTEYLFPDVTHLAMPAEKEDLFRSCGAEFVLYTEFPELRDLTPEEFASKILIASAHAAAVVCGYNYRFGKSGVGTPDDLKKTAGLTVSVEPEFLLDGESVSSTRIRTLLQDGNADTAAKLLGRPYALRAPVLHGKALGQKLGFPTVNQLFPEKMLIPRHGVYLTRCGLPDGRQFPALSNVGVRPTVETTGAVNCETHIPDFAEDLYGSTLTVEFLRFLRPERRFGSPEELQKQIGKDLEALNV